MLSPDVAEARISKASPALSEPLRQAFAEVSGADVEAAKAGASITNVQTHETASSKANNALLFKEISGRKAVCSPVDRLTGKDTGVSRMTPRLTLPSPKSCSPKGQGSTAAISVL